MNNKRHTIKSIVQKYRKNVSLNLSSILYCQKAKQYFHVSTKIKIPTEISAVKIQTNGVVSLNTNQSHGKFVDNKAERKSIKLGM